MGQSKEYWRTYYARNKERRKAAHKQYYERTKEIRAAKNKEYRSRPEVKERNRQQEWYRQQVDPEYRQRRRDACKRYVKRNADKVRQYASKFRAKMRAVVQDAKAGKSCIRCGESDPICLDFHHRDPNSKNENVAKLAAHCVGVERILEEIAKCDLICANCHRKLHRDERKGL